MFNEESYICPSILLNRVIFSREKEEKGNKLLSEENRVDND